MKRARRAPQHIAFVQPSAVLFGSERSLLELLRCLDRSAFTPHLIVLTEGPLVPAARELGIDVHVLPWLAGVWRRRPIAWLKAVIRLTGWFRRHHIDLVQLNLWFKIDGGLVAFAAWLAGARFILAARAAMPSWPALYDKFWISRADRVVSVTRAAVEPFFRWSRRSDLWSRIRPERVSIIPSGRNISALNGAGSDRNALRTSLGIPAKAPVVVMVAALERCKRQDLFLHAAALVVQAMPEAHFLLVGEPYARTLEQECYVDELHQMVLDLGLSQRVIFTGYRNDATELIRQCDALVLSSRREALGGVVIEAMAMGVPVVASADGGMVEVVQDGITGLLMFSDEPRDYADAILRVLDDPAYARRLSVAARIHAQRFDSECLTRQWEACYAQLSRALLT